MPVLRHRVQRLRSGQMRWLRLHRGWVIRLRLARALSHRARIRPRLALRRGPLQRIRWPLAGTGQSPMRMKLSPLAIPRQRAERARPQLATARLPTAQVRSRSVAFRRHRAPPHLRVAVARPLRATHRLRSATRRRLAGPTASPSVKVLRPTPTIIPSRLAATRPPPASTAPPSASTAANRAAALPLVMMLRLRVWSAPRLAIAPMRRAISARLSAHPPLPTGIAAFRSA